MAFIRRFTATGTKSTATKITEIIEKDLTSAAGGEVVSLQNSAEFIEALSTAIANSVDYPAYKKLKDSEKNTFRNELAKSLLDEIMQINGQQARESRDKLKQETKYKEEKAAGKIINDAHKKIWSQYPLAKLKISEIIENTLKKQWAPLNSLVKITSSNEVMGVSNNNMSNKK